MAWDETAFGREYDLDLFMIVAVRDFNFGAMENKGLNIFNSSLLLADADTATDADYERIESVVAHEYFHNWTGDRITCRDWFQLCLKEGLTVFRDQEFSSDMRGRAVQRIKDVKVLRARQFAEDAGPLAHPVRPTSYLKIDNFYTATIYEKGAEIIRMLKTLIGADAFAAGLDLYFNRWDGQAATVEAFIACFAESSGRDLTDFFAWYEQAGTPQVQIESVWSEADETMTLTFTQTPAAAAGADAKLLPIPVVLGLLDEEGRAMAPSELVMLDQPCVTLTRPAQRRPVVSAFRSFSAPVIVSSDAPERDLYLLMAADEDLFNRWDAGQTLGRRLILRRADGAADDVGEERYAEATGRALADQSADEAFKALMLTLPSETDLSLAQSPADPAALREAREALRARLARHLESVLFRLHASLHDGAPFTPDAAGAGRRALRNAAIDLLCAEPGADAATRAHGHYFGAANMTEAMGGLNALMLLGGPAFEEALSHFYDRWRGEPLVLDKWFAVQARAPDAGVLGRVIGLTTHPDFDPKTPNRLRALVQTFASANPARFHDPSGAGYRFLADQILSVDAFNPMTAARLLEPLGSWRRYREDLGSTMRQTLGRILDHPGVSKNVVELAAKALES
jgi:aminopeptidase N